MTLRLHRLHRFGFLYSAIPVLAGVYDAFEVAIHTSEQQPAINWITTNTQTSEPLADKS